MKLQQLLSLVRQAVKDYQMLEEGDCVAVGVSGGKDSLALLYAMAKLREFYPKKFQLKAITVDLGFPESEYTQIRCLCESLEIPYTVVRTEIAEILFQVRKEDHPCSLCSKLRKGALNEEAIRLGCNKIAYAHHKDDVIETMLMSLLYEGRFHTFSPVTHLEKSRLTVIRPLLYVYEADIIGFRNKLSLPVQKNPCPADGATKRETMKQMVRALQKETPGVKERLFHAVQSLPDWNRNNYSAVSEEAPGAAEFSSSGWKTS